MEASYARSRIPEDPECRTLYEQQEVLYELLSEFPGDTLADRVNDFIAQVLDRGDRFGTDRAACQFMNRWAVHQQEIWAEEHPAEVVEWQEEHPEDPEGWKALALVPYLGGGALAVVAAPSPPSPRISPALAAAPPPIGLEAAVGEARRVRVERRLREDLARSGGADLDPDELTRIFREEWDTEELELLAAILNISRAEVLYTGAAQRREAVIDDLLGSLDLLQQIGVYYSQQPQRAKRPLALEAGVAAPPAVLPIPFPVRGPLSLPLPPRAPLRLPSAEPGPKRPRLALPGPAGAPERPTATSLVRYGRAVGFPVLYRREAPPAPRPPSAWQLALRGRSEEKEFG